MTCPRYNNFDLKISRAEEVYHAQSRSADAGEADIRFEMPFSKRKLDSLMSRLTPSRDIRSRVEPGVEAAKIVGGGLYKSVFAGAIGNSLSRCIGAAAQIGDRVRIRLHLTEAAELANLPWEFLYDEQSHRFLVLSYKTSIARYLELAEPTSTLAIKPPLRVLVMTSTPLGSHSLSVEQEWENLQTALGAMPRGLVELERLKTSTLSGLQARLSQGGDCHVLHFIGHGRYDKSAGKSVLLLEDENGDGSPVDGERLGVLLHNHNAMRLVLLNSCEGASAAPHDVFSGVAQSLIRQGIPAVVAMQFRISDSAAVTLTSGFYESVARGAPVDAALLGARLAIFASAGGVEWGTPVLYSRAPDGRIFDADLSEFERKTADMSQPPSLDIEASEPEAAAREPIRPELPPMEPKGILPPQSPFYIERRADRTALDFISYPGSGVTLAIQACGQMGASSLLRRVIDRAKLAGKKAAHINFQQAFDDGDFTSAEDFHRRFCVVLTDRLEKQDHVAEYWERYGSLSLGDRCTKYVQYLLQSLGDQRLILAMDEVDLLIDTGFRSSFFGMLRSWHNERASDERFERLDLVMVTSLEPNQLIDDPNQSPFNVSGEVMLGDFSREEISRLCGLYAVALNSEEIESLSRWIGGHPYLWQLSIYQLAKGYCDGNQLLLAAKKQEGLYRGHLRSWYDFLQGRPSLRDALKDILSKREYDERAFLSLRRVGLVSRDGKMVRLRCKLYEDYFREQVHV